MAGDSAGAMLSMGVSLLARDRGDLSGKLAAQALLYPGTYYNQSTPSKEKYGEDAFLLPQGLLTGKWFHEQYYDEKTDLYQLALSDDVDQQLVVEGKGLPSDVTHTTQPYLNPWAAASLEGLPSTHVITAEYDPLHDENVLLFEVKLFNERRSILTVTQALQGAGVPGKLTQVEKTVHGFFVLPFLQETATTRQSIITSFKSVFDDLQNQ